jgi:hypothetical protein
MIRSDNDSTKCTSTVLAEVKVSTSPSSKPMFIHYPNWVDITARDMEGKGTFLFVHTMKAYVEVEV